MHAGAQEPPAAARSNGDADVQHDSAAAGTHHENLSKQQLKDQEELPAKPAAGSAPSITQVAAQEAAREGLARQDSEGTSQRKKKRSTFGSFFKRKSLPAK